VRVWRNW